MNKTTHRRRKGMGVIAALAVAGSMFAVPAASAYTGTADQNTGVVWGDGQYGTQNTPTSNGGSVESFPITDNTNLSEIAAKYGEPTAWGENLTPEQRSQVAVALYIGKMAQQDPKNMDESLKSVIDFLPKASDEIPNLTLPEGMIDQLEVLTDKTPDQMVAGAAAVVQKVGAEKTFDDSSLDADVKEVYDAIVKLAPALPETLTKDINLVSRTATDGDTTSTVLALDDIALPAIPMLKGYDFSKNVSADAAADETSTTDETEAEETDTTDTSETPSTSADAEDKVEIKVQPQPGSVVEQDKDIMVKFGFDNVEKGEEYTVKLLTVDKTTGEETGNEGVETFTAQEVSGEIDVPISVKNADSAQQVIYAYLYSGNSAEGEPIATIEDLNNEDLTIGEVRDNPSIESPSASSSTGDLIQSGTVVDVNGNYTDLIPGKKYRIEVRLVNGENGADTGAIKSDDFTAEVSNGSISVSGLEVADPDISLQVAFMRLYEMDGDTPYLVATYEQLDDQAMTIGATHDELYAEGGVIDQQGKGFYDKKKKKVAPESAPAPAPAAPAQPLGQGGGSGPAGNGSGPAPAPAPAPAPRQVINSVPSGDTEVEGNTAFDR